MGYILGQNSPRSAKLQTDASASGTPPITDTRPQPASPAPAPPLQASAPTTDSTGAPAPTSGAEAPAQPAPQPSTQPARDAAAGAPPQQPAAAAGSIPEAPPGSYWQVMALPQADAEGVARTLKEQGFPALLSPGTKNLTRVLVGPFKDTQSMGRAKTQLESAGFHPVKKSSE
jgi:hypothetical protein